MQGLGNIRVVDFSSWIAGPYASKLFADAGADVIKVEAGAGDPMRGWASTAASRQSLKDANNSDGAFFKFLNTSKRSVRGNPADAQVQQLIATADLLIEDFSFDSPAYRQLDINGLRKKYPRLVILSISPFGRSGPYANRPATEFTVQAESGSIAGRGLLTQSPIMAGGRTTDFIGGTYAAVAAQAAVRGAQASGQGEHVDFSLTEVMNLAASVYYDLLFSIMGRPEVPGPTRSVELPSIEPTKDGWVGFNTNSDKQFHAFLEMIGRPELAEDPDLASAWTRQHKMDEWNAIVRQWTTQHTTAEIVEKASALRIPVAPVNNGKTVLDHEQFKARGVYRKNPGGDFLQPGPPYRINGEYVTQPRPAPALGQHDGQVESRQPAEPSGKLDDNDLPLKGIRILDATAWWAGPAATEMLANLGADVIHLESIERYDGGRTVIGLPGSDEWWEWSHLHHGANYNKRDLTLDLASESGLALMHELIKQCDIIVENFTPRVFEGFGLNWQTIHELNPKALFVRMPAFGLDGPWRDNVGFAQTMEQMTGLAWLTGHVDDQPRIQRGPCDPLAGMHAAFAMLVGLAERDASGEGQFIEATMVEGALNVAAEQVIEYTAYDNVLGREGNRSPYAAPQGVYACDGEENWLALSVATDEQWESLVEFLGRPDWAVNEQSVTRYASLAQRREAHDLIDKHLSEWAAKQELDTVVNGLLVAGIPAATLYEGNQAYRHPQLVARRFFEMVDHPVIGSHPIPTVPFHFASRQDKPWIRRPAPTLGQHNHEILGQMLGVSEEKIAELETQGVIGNKPKGS